MKIALDMRGSQPGYKKHLHRGIGRIIGGIAPRLAALIPDAEFIQILDGRYDRPEVEIGTGANEIVIEQKVPFKHQEILKNHVGLWPLLHKRDPDITLFFCHEDALLFWPRSALFVLDLIPERLPGLYNTYAGLKNRIRQGVLKKMARQASLVFTISENSKKDIAGLWDLPSEKIRVVYAGIDTGTFYRRNAEEVSNLLGKYSLPQDYILYVGGIDPRKNVPILLEAFDIVIRSCRTTLVMAGRIKEQDEYPVIDSAIKRHRLEDRVIFTGHVPDSELPALYSGASLTVFPSLYEGFGLPVLESLACGTPVVTSALSSIPEVAGDLAVFSDVENPESLAAAIEKTMHDRSLSEKTLHLGPERAEMFSWEGVAGRTAEGLISILGSGAR